MKFIISENEKMPIEITKKTIKIYHCDNQFLLPPTKLSQYKCMIGESVSDNICFPLKYYITTNNITLTIEKNGNILLEYHGYGLPIIRTRSGYIVDDNNVNFK
jgi:hypothetical protein